MLRITNVYADFGRLKAYARSRYVEGNAPVVFSWSAENGLKNSYQAAFRLTLSAEGFSYDSGWVETRVQRHTADARLPEGVPVTLTLIVRDNFGNESAAYTNTIYNADVSWRAGWIGAKEPAEGRDLCFRREFSVKDGLKSAVIYACGIGWHKLYLNGAELDAAALDPAHTDYAKTCQYVMLPVDPRAGVNCIAAEVASGWRKNAFKDNDLGGGRRVGFMGEPMFTAMVKLTYADGETQWIMTDDTWQCGFGARFSDIFSGETYDAHLSRTGWTEPGFTGFDTAVTLPGPGGKLKPMVLNPVLEHKRRKPIARWTLDDGTVICDFGQNLAGVLCVKLPAKLSEGQVITLRHAEELTEEGELFTGPLRSAQATDRYIASGDGRDLDCFMPQFTYHGFRYASVNGLDPDEIEAVELHTDLEKNSCFRCGDPRATRLHEICVETERSNQHSILTDCPQRNERMGWMNDATVRFEETPYNFETGRMFTKLTRDIMDAQSADGAITCTAPFVYGSRPADPVCSSFLVAGRESLMHSGNIELIKEAFKAYENWENCLLAHSDGYIVNYGYYGDWAAPVYACITKSIGDGAASAVTPNEFMSTGYSYYNCTLLSGFARELNDGAAEKYWDDMAEKVKTALLDKWFDPEKLTVCTDSQACRVFALWLGILPGDAAERVAEMLRDDLRANDYRFTTGNLCTRYLMDVLTRFGYVDDAWALITKQTYPSFGYMLEQEATTVWERFELKKAPGMNSHNHPMYGAVDYWFYAYLCGIKPAAPDFAAFTVKPCFPEGLMSAQATVDTVKGPVSVRWVKRYEKTVLQLTVPFGTEACVDFGGKISVCGSGFWVFEQ